MSYELNEKIKGLTPYTPMTGEYDVRLDANESFLTPPAWLLEEMAQVLTALPLNRYPDPYATELCELFAAFYQLRPQCVTAGNGSDELISVLVNAFLQKGDRVVVTAPDFSMYQFYAHLAECPVTVLEKNEDLSLDFDALADLSNRTGARMILFSNPCNPTSAGFQREGIRRLLRNTKSLVVLDEAYMDFFDQSLLPDVEEYPNLIVLRTCSKALGLAACRVGFAVANETLTNAIRAVKSPYNVNALSQAVASVLLRHPDLLREGIRTIIRSRDDLYQRLQQLQQQYVGRMRVIKPDTNFVMVWLDNAGSMFNSLREDGILVRNIGEFLRITAGTPAENELVTDKIAGYLSGEGFR